MARSTIDFGIDLGTTNSSIAVMNDGVVQVIRNADGMEVTPSVVRVAGDGAITVGRRAKQMLDLDPDNTRAEFKRVMGTMEDVLFAKSGKRLTPDALSAEVLKSLRADARDQLGEEVRAAVVTVPALFEIPQCEATARAARLAGLDVAPLLQEPIASAIACGYREASDVHGYWVVYDFGGGTFDTSLLLTREGRMQVVDHDGDNFLGGKDFDWLIVDHVARRVRDERSVAGLERSSTEPVIRRAFAKLKAAAEDAKILLSRAQKATLQVEELLDGVDVSIEITRDELDAMIASRVARSIEIVLKLLARNHVASRDIEKLIFVGGPTLTPSLRSTVEGALGIRGEAGVDPLTIVAQGAAIHAAAQRLESSDEPVATAAGQARSIKIEYPPISQDMEPFVAGRVPPGARGEADASYVEVNAVDGSFQSGRVPLNERGGFTLSVRLHKKGTTRFRVRVFDVRGDAIPVAPDEFAVRYGMVVAEPPLSRSIGVATADNYVRRYVEKGASLPARRTFTHKTIEAIRGGSGESILKVPVVQGESPQADRNRLIGTLEIPGGGLRRSLPIGTEVEVTIDVDGSGTVRAQAFVPLVDQIFERVVTLAMPKADPEKISAALWAERGRLSKLRSSASELGAAEAIGLSRGADDMIIEVELALEAAKGGDADAAQQAVRRLLDLEILLDQVEAALKWPEIEREVDSALGRARMAVIEEGSTLERQHFEQLEGEVKAARENRDAATLEWKSHELHNLAWAIESRDPASWVWQFDYLASTPAGFTDVAQAQGLIAKGKAAKDRAAIQELKEIVRGLWRLRPPDEEDRVKGYGSGVR